MRRPPHDIMPRTTVRLPPWLAWTLAIPALAATLGVLAVVGVGALLPEAHTAARSVRLAQSRDAVWEAITDVESAPAWRSDLERVDPLPEADGRRHWREVTEDSTIRYVAEDARPPERLVVRIAEERLPFGGRWVYELTPAAGGTRLTITEEGEVYNPIFRFVSRFVVGHETALDAYLRDLARHFGESARPGPPPGG